MGWLKRASTRSTEAFWAEAGLLPGERRIEYAHVGLLTPEQIDATLFVTDRRLIVRLARGGRWDHPLDQVLAIQVCPTAPLPAFRVITFDAEDAEVAGFMDVVPWRQSFSTVLLCERLRDALAVTAGFMTPDGKGIPSRHITSTDYARRQKEGNGPA